LSVVMLPACWCFNFLGDSIGDMPFTSKY
jgi:hypothetical protein